MNETPPILMPSNATTTVLKPKKRLTVLELYAIVQRVSRSLPHIPSAKATNTLRQIAAGQDIRLRTVLERDAALTFVARSKGSIVPVDPQRVKDATDIAARASLKLKTLPHGDRRTRRLAARELDRAKRRMAHPKTEYRVAT